MATRPKNSETVSLERYRVSLENAESQPEIATAMAELGYNPAKITEGKNLLAQTRSVYDLNKTEDDETSAAYAVFSSKKAALTKIYKTHRKKAKVVFRDDSLTANKLAITGEMPDTYINWFEGVKKFYSLATSDTDIQTKLSRLAITPESLAEANTLITEIEDARTVYLKEVGESQNATKAKDAAMATMGYWMSEFYAVARIGLEDKPQLLEALGITVKS
jgi:inosine/xanthosine triphosphate pyrophosphatase family protein